ncbi:NAD(P)-dependent oxidoreductase [Leucobacter sp. wl10]|uniref:NAD(P)-dependent oxidoreductase n=1 Tax=Leucobacter sp. wl10 TaxID=2304677 RepID=UPI000E5C03BB|nr:NAD(P)H-binding protein [Leucobacter sp. wl10]RGE18065.1 NAD-dependent epimerase/dehydratase family protein [Leucobacter sp. wl10]
MTRVTVIGGSGYAGSHIVETAAVRSLEVTSMARGEVAEQIGGVRYLKGSITEAADRAAALDGADVVVVAVSPRGDMVGRVRPAVAALAAEAAAAGVRLGVIGGAGSLLQREGGELVMDGPDFAEEVKPEASEMGGVLDDLRAAPAELDWFFVSPPATFGAWAAGEYRGEYRVGGDVLLTDADGGSEISGADFGAAVVDEIEEPKHRGSRFTVAY